MPIGYHVGRTGGGIVPSLTDAILDLRSYGFANICAQIFVTGPQSFKKIMSDNDVATCRDIIKKNNLNLVIHGAYVDHPWNRAAASIHNIKEEMKIARALGATGVIVHLGAGATDDGNLDYVFEMISRIDADIRDNVTLWLEIHVAKPGHNTFETPQKLGKLFKRVARYKRGLTVGLCIDTAHLYSCGVSLDTHLRAERWLSSLERLTPGVPKMLHLNDSAAGLGSGIDRHCRLTGCNIWGAYGADGAPIEHSGIIPILDWAEGNNIDVILERGDGLEDDLQLICALGYFR